MHCATFVWRMNSGQLVASSATLRECFGEPPWAADRVLLRGLLLASAQCVWCDTEHQLERLSMLMHLLNLLCADRSLSIPVLCHFKE